MLKKIVLLISSFLLFSVSALALTKSEIEIEMKSKIDNVLQILKNDSLKKESKSTKIIQLMDPVFDYTLMSRLSLGRTWKEISNDQQNEFIKLFTKELKKSYVSKLDLYTDEIVKIVGVQTPKTNRLILNTLLVGKTEKYEINYKFYQSSNADTWLIYDVELIGVSIIQTYRQQYSGFLKENSFDDLLALMKNKK